MRHLHVLVAAAWLAVACEAAAAAAEQSIEEARQNLEQLKKRLAEESGIGWMHIVLAGICCLVAVLSTVPVLLWCMAPRRPQLAPVEDLQAPRKAAAAARGSLGVRKQPRRRQPKWTLDDVTWKPQDLPAAAADQGSRSFKDTVERYATQKRHGDDSSSDGAQGEEEEEQKLTPEEIIRRHQEMPREPHVGIFIGVDQPRPSAPDAACHNPRCSVDARDLSDEFSKLDYRVYCLHDHSKQADRSMLPTRTCLAAVIQGLKLGRYDDETRRRPNTSPWHTCLVYLATRVRVATSRDGAALEFMLRQEHEPGDGVWIGITELLNKISDIPHRHTVVLLDVVHTGQEDVRYDYAAREDRPDPGERQSMAELLFRCGRTCGLVDNLRVGVVGCTRPDPLPRSIAAEGGEKKLRRGPMAHFMVTGLQDVDKQDPNRELWERAAQQAGIGVGGGMLAGGLGAMPAAAPVTVGDLEMCPFHCGDMTVDSVYRFLAKKMRALTQDPCCDPAYAAGSVNMAFAHQRAMRPRETPATPCYMHECKREALVKEVVAALRSQQAEKPTTVALLGPPGVGKTSLALAIAWRQEVLNHFVEGQFYFSVRRELQQHEAQGRLFVREMQTILGQAACGLEGVVPDAEQGAIYLKNNFAHLRTLVVVDDLCCGGDVGRLLEGMGVPQARAAGRTVRNALLVATDSPEVAAACGTQIAVPPLGEGEARQLLAAAAGYMAPGDLPEAAGQLLQQSGNLPLAAAALGAAMRGAEEEAWEAARADFKQVPHGQPSEAVRKLVELLPADMLHCLRRMALLPPGRSVVIHALPTLWSEAGAGPMEVNQAHSLLARILEAGVGALVLEDGEPNRKRDTCAESALLLHPAVAAVLRDPGVDGDRAVVDAYATAAASGGGTPWPLESAAAELWSSWSWDGYYHTHMPAHLDRACPALASALYRCARWVTAQLEAAGVDKTLADLRRFGRLDDVVTAAVCAALEGARLPVRQRPWEGLPQLYARLCTHPAPAVQQFCADLSAPSRPAQPADGFLWLRPLFGHSPFDPEANNTGSPALSVMFWKDYLVSGHADGRVILWRLQDGVQHKTLTGHKGAVHVLVTAKDGSIASGSREEEQAARIRVWDAEDGTCQVLSMDQKPETADKEDNAFGFKATLGRSGFDNGDRDGSELYSYTRFDKMIEDSLLLEAERHSDGTNCHTFFGWDAHSVATSLTVGGKVHAWRCGDYQGRLLLASGDSAGRVLFYELCTNDSKGPAGGDDGSVDAAGSADGATGEELD
eukprot:TRINITY_DN18391_c0_g2_i1.p1 TRINITY_DN18391_c0_g2~~TRINITY_DN18391_c0_g2_i1.p1  ORF type:complete len:1270 (+),score=446.15 TRINITY_DN18391_c0_g2_i1:111-3920(+)